MAYQVIARRWRPQNFNEVVYQDHVSQTIRNSIKNNRISHAYIFSGPRGVGKTTTARIFAKSLNCIEGPTTDPCGKCENCLEIKNSTSFDVIEIDGASNNGVDNIRDLREKVNFAPIKSKYKVYIIDEVHMLTEQAFNALLKTLEEPPAHVVFVFATTEIHKVPDTILSRCQKYFFKKITVDAIAGQLKKIIEKENYNIIESVIFSVARAAEGSMRDAQSLLEQIISFSDENIDENSIFPILGILPLTSYVEILKRIVDVDAKGVIDEVTKVISLGVDIPRFVAGFLDVIRSVRLIKNNIAVKHILDYSDDEISKLKEISEKLCDEELSSIFKIGNDLQNELRFSVNDRINLEMSLLDMISIKSRPSLSAIINQISNLSQSEKKKEIIEKTNTTNIIPSASEKTVKQNNSEVKSHTDISNSNIKDEWLSFLSQTKIIKQYLFQKLKTAKIDFIDDSIIIAYPQNEGEYYSRMLDNQDINFINDELSKRLKRKISVRLANEQKDGEQKEDEKKIPSELAIGEEDEAPLPDAEMQNVDDFDELKQNHPVVKKLVDIFYGEIVEKGE